ncbi:hypothetical protein [uncultured Brevundimonas sp.]|uniref:hypothetical protein n=1 Tax=uncultured Brevundimonas sp. TaxID=213418 RepID=UPI0025E6A55F|nr:hypothetical protein [uncultured Brevundimonas sp.]
MGKALKAVGTAIVIVGAIAATGGAALAFGAGAGVLGSASLATSAVLSVGSFSVSAGALLTVGSLVSSVGGALSQPKVSTAGSALGWVGDPNGPMHFAVGRIAVAGDLRHKKAYGPNDRMYFSAVTVVSDAGPITEFESFTANDIPVTFDVNGKANTSYFANVMWMRRQLGNQPEASYLASPSGLERGATLPDWGPSHKLSGKAGFIVTLSENSKGSAYKGQQPKPRHIIKGLRVYDWRQDSTYPGGAGSQRLNDPTTWTFSENPALWAAKWTYGLWEGPTGRGAPQIDYQVGGIGVTPGVIDFASLTELANIADTHGWKVAAWPSTDDDKAQVLNAFLQAAGAYYIEKSGKMSCLHRAAPRVSVATVTAADTAGPIELDTSSSYVDRKNTGVPTYLSEADGWKMTALGEVSAPEWVTQDGGRQRSMPMTYSFVPVAKQAAELMCLGIANTREGISGRIPLKPYMQGIEAGSAFTITEPEFVLNGLKCLALETSYDATTGVHTVTFVSETDGKYAYAYGQSPTPPAPPALEAVDPTFVTPPLPSDWVITPRPPGTGTGQLPTFDLSGVVSNDTATSILVEFYEVAAGVDPYAEPPTDIGWESAGVWPPTATAIPITVQPDRYYWVGIRNIRNSNYSARQTWGPYLAGKLLADVDPSVLEGLPAFQDLLNQSRETLDQLLKLANDRATGALKELEDRRSQVRDLLIRQGLIAETDPVAGAAILRDDVLIQGTGGQTLAQTLTLLYAADDNAEALVSLEQLARIAGDQAEASARIAAIAAQQNALAATDLSLRAYTDGKVATATAGLATTAAVDNAINSASATLRSYADSAVATGTAGLATTSALTAGDNAAKAAAAIDAQSRVDAYAATAALNFVAVSVFNGLQSTVGLQGTAISGLQAQNNLARLELFAAAGGGQPARLSLVSNSLGSAIALLASQIYFGPTSYLDAATYTLRTTIGDKIRVIAWGSPFGSAGDLLEWWGPAGTPIGSMNAGNGFNGRMTAAPYVFDNTLASSFSASTNTGFIGGGRNGAGPVQTSNSVTVTVAGGTSGATIRWVRISGDSRINMNDPNGFTTGAYATIGVGEVISAYFMGAVTKNGQSAVVYVQVDLSDNGT